MTPDRHALVREIFLEAIARPEAERKAFLDQRCKDDPDARKQLDLLLANYTAEPAPPPSSARTLNRDANNAVAAPTSLSKPAVDSSPIEFVAGDMVAKRYRIHGRLGEGATGVVFRADDMVLSQPVAIKFLRAKAAIHSSMRERFRREVRMALKVSHPNVCRVFDIGESEGRTYFTMEFCGGEDLSHLIRRAGRLSLQKGAEIARQICSGLAAAHAAGVLHRDLKPANILLDAKGRVLITDFGIAAAVDVPGFREIAGTPGYMAPEQIIGIGVDERSDVYSLGLVMYELFAGRAAYAGGSVREALDRQIAGQPPPLSEIVPDIDPDVDSLINKCMARERDQRPSSALAVAAALPGVDALAIAQEADQTAPPSLVGDSSSLARRLSRPAVWAAVAVIGCLLLPFVRGWSGFPWDDSASKPAAVLLDRARAVSRIVPTHDQFPFSTSGYCDQDRARRLLEQFLGALPSGYSVGRPDSLYFWYREAQAPLTPSSVDTLIFGPGQTTSSDPPILGSAQRVVLLDSRGRLVVYGGHDFRLSESAPDPLDVARLREAGAAQSSGSAVAEVAWPTPHSSKGCTASEVTLPEGAPGLAVNCLSQDFAEVFAVLEKSKEAVEAQSSASGNLRTVIASDRLRILYVVTVIIAFPIALRNVRLSRSDLRGSSNLCWLFLIANLLAWMLRAAHGDTPNTTITLVAVALLRAFGLVAMVLVYYVALEPLARKYYPHLLIVWTRLLQARSATNALHHHLLAGLTMGVMLALLFAMDYAVVNAMTDGQPEAVFTKQVGQRIYGAGSMLAGVLQSAQSAIGQGLLILLLLTLARMMLRNNLPALAATGVFLLLLVMPRGPDFPVSLVLLGGVGCGLILWLMMQFGLLALVTALFVFDVLQSTPMSVRPSDWFFPATACFLGVPVAAAVYLCYRCRRAQTGSGFFPDS